MLKYVAAFCFITVGLGLWMIAHFGIQPRTIMVIKPSYVESDTEAGKLIHRVLYPRIAMHKFVSWGLRLEDSTKFPMLQGFLQAAKDSGKHFDAVVFVSLHRDSTQFEGSTEFVDVPSGGEELTRVLQNYLIQNKRVLLVLNALEAVHFRKESEVLAQETKLKTKIVSVVTMPVSEKEEGIIDTQVEECPERAEDEKYVHSLGCLQQKKSKHVILKDLTSKNKFAKDRFMIILDQEGERDYLSYYFSR